MLKRVLQSVIVGYGATAMMDASRRELIPALFSAAQTPSAEIRGLQGRGLRG